MSDASYYFDEAVASKHKDTERPRKERLLQRVVIALAIILFAELVWFFALIPCMPFTSVQINGIEGLDRDRILSIAGFDDKASYMNLNSKTIIQSLEQIPQIESVQVHKTFPDSVSIEVLRRKPVALSLATLNGATVPVYIDRHGVVFGIGHSAVDANTNEQTLPVISGLVFEQLRTGMRLPEMLLPLLENLNSLQRTAPELLSVISEIRINSRPYNGFDVLIYPAHRPVRVRTGPELNEESLRYMMLILDVLASKNIEADEIDFRTGTVAYRTKEATSG